MKLKYLSRLMVAALLVGCSNDPTEDNGNQSNNSEEKSYLSISIKATPTSRDGETKADYEKGSDTENDVKNALFFFFDEAGEPFNVNNTLNFVEKTDFTSDGDNMDNVEEKLSTLVVIEKHTGTFPASIVAVLNMNAPTAATSLTNLQQQLNSGFNTVSETTYFTMSNAVFKNAAGEVQIAEPLTIANVATTAELAKANPVEIYVERVASKVRVTNLTTVTFNTGTTITPVGSTNAITVYAKVVGWDINTTRDNAYLMKYFDTTKDYWTEAMLSGFAWNHAEWHRSYWAESATTGTMLKKSFTWNSLSHSLGDNVYCLENTVTPADNDDPTIARTDITKVLVAAQLKDGEGENAKDVVVAKWYGNNYLLASLKSAVASTLSQMLIQKTTTESGSDVYTPIDPDQLDCVQSTQSKDSYKCYFTLAEGVDTNNWYKIEGGTYVEVTNPNTVLAQVEPASIWNGKSYYIVNIRHLGTAEKDANGDYLAGYYGIVRNHIYEINIEGVSGLGTPVYDPTSTIPEPVTPEETEAYIAARINILSWRLVTNDVTLGQ